jgi:hypothetical protein
VQNQSPVRIAADGKRYNSKFHISNVESVCARNGCLACSPVRPGELSAALSAPARELPLMRRRSRDCFGDPLECQPGEKGGHTERYPA